MRGCSPALREILQLRLFRVRFVVPALREILQLRLFRVRFVVPALRVILEKRSERRQANGVVQTRSTVASRFLRAKLLPHWRAKLGQGTFAARLDRQRPVKFLAPE